MSHIISAFHPKALNVVKVKLAGLLAWLLLNTFPLVSISNINSGMKIQQVNSE
jgi:hypothetical protein